MGKLNRLSSKMMSVLTSAEAKHLSRKSTLQRREQDVLAREQTLAICEEEVTGRIKAFDIREQQLKNEIEQRLTEDHRKELETRDLAHKDISQVLEDIKNDLHLEQEQAKAAKLQAI